MNNKYKETATAIRHAEEALETLKAFSESQYKAKGETMLEQISDYIANTLTNANYMCCGCKYYHLSLSKFNNEFVFYIYDNSAIGSGYPIFRVTKYGVINKIHDKLPEWMMLTLVNEWSGFKENLNFAIQTTLENRTKSINSALSYIGYVNEQLSKWKV